MDFGQAIEALKNGEMIQREGWNGKGLFVFMQVPAIIPSHIVPNMLLLPLKVKDKFIKRFGKPYGITELYYNNQLAIVDVDNNINGWSLSVSDSLATDWTILN